MCETGWCCRMEVDQGGVMPNKLVELTIEECLEHLRSGVLGRVAMSTPMGPRIVPLNYAMHNDEIRDIRARWDPTPWAGGHRLFYLKLRWRDITGRRIGGESNRDSMMSVRH